MSRFAAAILSFLGVSSAQAYQFPIFGNFSPENAGDEQNISAYDFRGIVGLSNCSGSIVRFDDSRDTDRAMVLSNGHCVEMMTPGKVISNKQARKAFTVLGQAANKLGTVYSEKIIYATMTNTDASLFLLSETYADIKTKYGVEALTFSREAPGNGTNIEILSGYWKRGYSCQVEATIGKLKEDDWTFTDSVRYSRPGCETIGGTSGSPVLETGTRTVVAVNNTGNEDGELCTMNNPCEISEDGKPVAYKGYSYAQQTYWFYSCRNESGALDLKVQGCLLPK